MSNRGGNGGYSHSGVQPNHSSRNFGPNRAPNINHQPRHLLPPNNTNIPQTVSNVGLGYQHYINQPGLVPHPIPQVSRAQYTNIQHHHQQHLASLPFVPIQMHYAHAYTMSQQIHPNQINTAYATRNVSGTTANPTPYAVSQAMVPATDNQLYYSEQYIPQPSTQDLNTVTPSMQHPQHPQTGQPMAVKSANTARPTKKLTFVDPSTGKELSEDYLRSSSNVKPDAVNSDSSKTNATSTTASVNASVGSSLKTKPGSEAKEQTDNLDIGKESDSVTPNTDSAPEPKKDSSEPTNGSTILSSRQAVTDSKAEPSKDSSSSSTTTSITTSGSITSSSKQAVIETKTEPKEESNISPIGSTSLSPPKQVTESEPELKSVEPTQQSSTSIDIPKSHEASSPSEPKDTPSDVPRQKASIDVVDHASVISRDEKLTSPPSDFTQSKSVQETSIDKTPSPSENEEEIKDKPASEPPKVNSKGKYEYEADFLRSLQSHPLSLKKPDLPDLDIVQQVPIPHREKPTNRINDFLPSYMAPSRNNRSLPPRISGRNSRELRPSKPPIKIIPSPSLTQDVALHSVENAWKPAIPSLKPPENTDQDPKKTELVKRFRGILNKLTPQKYDDLIKQVDALVIDTEDKLNAVLELIFDKAVDEPAFCTDYAKLCKHISVTEKSKKSSDDKDKTSEKDEKFKDKQFRLLLLKRCQTEFESDIYKDIDIDGRLKSIESITDPEKRRIAELELDEDKRKARKRSLGIIKFIGELYMFDMLRVLIMDSCMNKLLKASDDESLECLCTLLRTVGAKWEEDHCRKNAFEQINFCMGQLQAIVESRSTSSRVRFMIQDVLDMKRAGWKVRKVQAENKPKTMDQLHAEIQAEEMNKKHEIQQHMIKSGDTRKMPTKQEEWNSQRNSRNNTPNTIQMIEQFKKLSANPSQSDTLSLQPQRGLWGSGASLGASSQRQPNSDIFGRNSLNEKDKNPRTSGNTMGRDSMESRQPFGSGRPFSSVEGEPHSGYPGRASMGNRMPSSVAPFSNSTDLSVKKDISSRSSSMEKSGHTDSRASSSNSNNLVRESPKKEVTPASTSKFKGKKELSEDQVQDKAIFAMQEFLNHGMKDDAKEDLYDICTEKNVHFYVQGVISMALELSSQEQRLRIGELLFYLIKEKVIKQEHFIKGLHSILNISSDFLIDIPKFWDNLGDILVPVFCGLEDSSRKKFFTKALDPCKDDEKFGAVLIMCRLLKYTKSDPKHPYDCASAWASASLDWNLFIPSKEKSPEEFFKKNNLTMPVFDFQTRLDIMSNYIKNHNASSLTDYINQKFTSSEVMEKKFLSALTNAVATKCISQSGSPPAWKLNTKEFSKFCGVLKQFHKESRHLELEIIFAVQVLIATYENPKGLLIDLFDHLRKKANISDQAFIEWEGDNTVPKNKGSAIHTVKEFLLKCKEGGSGSDS